MNDVVEREVVDPDHSSLINLAEINQQVATAKKFPRSLKAFRDEAMEMVTLNETVAQECIYALPRDGKMIEGPSARMAEVLASAWGNCRAGARVVDDTGDFVTAQGVFYDLQKNVSITYEVQRRIINKNGDRYKPDMIGVTANAACSIALRNAVLKGIPKAFWADVYNAARKVIMGDFSTLANKRSEALKQFQAYGVTDQMIFDMLEVKGKEDITIEDLVVLSGLLTAIRDGDTTVEQTFPSATKTGVSEPKPYPDDKFKENLPRWLEVMKQTGKSGDDMIAFLSSKGNLFSDEQKAQIRGEKPAENAADKAGSSQAIGAKEPAGETTKAGGSPEAANDEAPRPGEAVEVTAERLYTQIEEATDVDVLDVHADLIRLVHDAKDKKKLNALYKKRRKELVESQ